MNENFTSKEIISISSGAVRMITFWIFRVIFLWVTRPVPWIIDGLSRCGSLNDPG